MELSGFEPWSRECGSENVVHYVNAMCHSDREQRLRVHGVRFVLSRYFSVAVKLLSSN